MTFAPGRMHGRELLPVAGCCRQEILLDLSRFLIVISCRAGLMPASAFAILGWCLHPIPVHGQMSTCRARIPSASKRLRLGARIALLHSIQDCRSACAALPREPWRPAALHGANQKVWKRTEVLLASGDESHKSGSCKRRQRVQPRRNPIMGARPAHSPKGGPFFSWRIESPLMRPAMFQNEKRSANCMKRGLVSVDKYFPNCVGS